jgi:ribosome-associated protein
VEAAVEKQAAEIVLLDIGKVSSFADYFIICSGESWRQIEAIGEEIISVLKKGGVYSHHSEGTVRSGWVLLDFGAVIVHIFDPEKRQYYGLDELWDKARPVVKIQ